MSRIHVSGGCFQRPTCQDDSDSSVLDTHGIGEELFTVNVPIPTDQFTGQSFSDLSFSIDSKTLDVATIHPSTGESIFL